MEYYINDDTIIFNYKFNEPLDNYIGAIKNCKKIIFSDYDDYKICMETNNKYIEKYVRHYKCSRFNQPLSNLLNNLNNITQLTFGYCFNHPISGALNNLNKLTQLTLGYMFDQELNIPLNIKILKLDCNNKIIDNLPNSIEELYLGEYFNSELNNLPNSIKIISFVKYSKYNRELNNLSKSLEKLYLPEKYDKKIMNISEECVISKKVD
jgi:hypothetical protein